MDIVVWVCPECGNFFASSNAGDLSQQWNVDKISRKPTFPRSQCPNHACAIKGVLRQPVTFRSAVKLEE